MAMVTEKDEEGEGDLESYMGGLARGNGVNVNKYQQSVRELVAEFSGNDDVIADDFGGLNASLPGGFEFEIKVKEGERLPAPEGARQYSPLEEQALQEFLDEMLAKGWVQRRAERNNVRRARRLM